MEPLNPAPNPLPLGYERPGQPLNLPFPDQRGGMKMMGVVLMVLGSFSGCMTGLMPLAMLTPRLAGAQATAGQQPHLRDVIGSVLMFGTGAAALFTVGAGSYRARRWSRPIALILLGTWMITGMAGFISYVLYAPNMKKMMQAAATGPSAATMPALPSSFIALSGGCMLVFFVVLPGVLFWFFKRPAVQQTLDYFDPRRIWTDRCATPVLAISLWLALGALALLGYCVWGIFPAFGKLLHGWPAIIAILATAFAMLVLAIATYRSHPVAWWATVLLVILGMTSTILTFMKTDPLDIYRLSGSPPEQVRMMEQAGIGTRRNFIIQQGINGTAILVYLLWARRFFTRGPRPI
jgi:hypothetical protein